MWRILLVTCLLAPSWAISCPRHCHCYFDENQMMAANCSGPALTTHQQPSQIEIFNVRPHYRGYPTRLLPKSFRSFKNIKFLNLKNTSVAQLPNDVFYGLNYIIKIDLSFNKIKHLNGVVFKDLGSLNTLLLRGNPLMLDPWDAIFSSSLKILDMGYCGLRTIPARTFSYITNLSALYLDGNDLHTLGHHTLPSGLWYLNLTFNRITNVPTEVFLSMKALTRLDLSGNPVNCTCKLLLWQDFFSGKGGTIGDDVRCAEPHHATGQKLGMVVEDDLCRKELDQKERLVNHVLHYRDVRPHRKHNMIHDPYAVQGDQPYASDELVGHDSEIVYADDKTRSLGTHQEHSLPEIPIPTDISDENNKLGDSKSDLLNTDPSSTELDVKEVDLPDDKTTPDHHMTENKEISTENSITEPDLKTGPEKPDETESSSEKTISDDSSKAESIEESIKEIEHSTESIMSSDDLATSALGNFTDIEKHGESTELITTDSDVEDIGFTLNTTHERMAQYSSQDNTTYGELDEADLSSPVDDIFGGDVLSTEGPDAAEAKEETYTFPTSASDITDYSYDAQHDYTSGEARAATPSNVTEETDVDPEASGADTTESYTTSESDTNGTLFDYDEGSGEESNETITDAATTVKWMDEQENETTTSGYSIVNVSEFFNVTSGGVSESDAFSTYSTDVTSDDDFVSENSTGGFSEEVTTEAEVTTFSEDTAGGVTSVSDTRETSTEESTTLPTEQSSEGTTVPPESSSLGQTSEQSAQYSSETPMTSESTTDSALHGGSFGDETSERLDGETSSGAPISEVPLDTSSDTSVRLPLTTDGYASSTAVVEVEIVSKHVEEDLNENIIEDSMKKEITMYGEGKEETNVAMIGIIGIIVLLVLIIIVISLAVVCRKTKRPKNKVRLPTDPESAPGTEMQDMLLLPKPPENGVKIVPKNYTNGTTATTANGKKADAKDEEATPVLAAEAEADAPAQEREWDDKPEPIETVTARLCMLARPQTPVFIPNSLN